MSRPVVTAWSTVSPFGIGAKAFADGVGAGATGLAELDPATWSVPQTRAALVPGFDIREVLGRPGTRSMDRLSALSVAAVGDLLDADDRNRAVATGDRAGLVLGTTAGSAKSMMDITRDTLTQQKPFFIQTGTIPNAIMNSAAAQCAIWHGLRGPNATIAGGRVAGLFALRYSLRLLSAGRADAVLTGGAEEFTAERAWLEHHGRGDGPTVPLGEGSGVLLVEPAPAGPDAAGGLAEILAVEIGLHTADPLPVALAAFVRRTLDRAGVEPAEVWALSPAGTAAAGDAECDALTAALSGHRPRRLPGDEVWGDAGAATATFQLASVLAAAEHDPAARGAVAAVAGVDRDGALGCALLRLPR